MVQVLPGFAPQLGQNLASILGSVQHVIDPNWEEKEFIKKQVLTNPEYAQKLANFAHSNPEVYKKMGLGKVGDTIAEISPDLKTVMDEAKKGYVQEAAKNPNKELAASAGQTALYGKDQLQLEAEQQNNMQAGLNLALTRQNMKLTEQRIAEGKNKMAALDLEAKGISEAAANYSGLQQLDLGDLAEKFVNKGKLDTSLLVQINSVPQLKESFDKLVNIKEQQKQFNKQVEIANIRHGQETKDAATQMWIRSEGAGTPELWNQYMHDPATQDRLFKLIADPKIAETPKDQMLIQMFNSISEKQLGRNSKMVQALMPAINKAVIGSRTATADMSTIKEHLNTMYQRLGDATGDYYQADIETTKKPDTSHFWQRTNEGSFRRIKIIDLRTMQEVQPSTMVASASGAPVPSAPPQNIVMHQPYPLNKDIRDSTAAANAKPDTGNVDLGKTAPKTETKTTTPSNVSRVNKAIAILKGRNKEDVAATLAAPVNSGLTQAQKDSILTGLGFKK